MKKDKKKTIRILLIILTILSIRANVYAHSGKTDSNGGHKDNQNKSGLGSYHYHCGEHPAHLHTNVICPYALIHHQLKAIHRVILQTKKQQVQYQKILM